MSSFSILLSFLSFFDQVHPLTGFPEARRVKLLYNFGFLSFSFSKFHVQLSLEHEHFKIIVLVFGEPLFR
jgi:hypothetical protein